MFNVSLGEDAIRRTRSQAEESNRGFGDVKKLLWQAAMGAAAGDGKDVCSAANGWRLRARTVVVVKRSEAPAGVVIRWVGC